MRKKILYLSHHGEFRGGGEISLFELIKNIDLTRFEPIVVSPSKGELVEELEKLHLKTKIISMLPLRGLRNLLIPKTALGIAYFVRRNRIALIHSNSTKCALYGGLASKLRPIPHIWHVRTRNPEGFVDKILPHLSSKIIAVSKFVSRRGLINQTPTKKLALIYNGVDTKKFSPAVKQNQGVGSSPRSNLLRKELGIPKSTFLIGTVGQLLPYKGHKFLIQAIKELIEQCDGSSRQGGTPTCVGATSRLRNLKLLIVGDERKKGYKKELQMEAESVGIQDRVIFLKFRKDVPELLNALDLFVLPSVHEHFGRVLIEAMACAKPVVATNAGGSPEIVVNNITGLLVPPESSTSLKDAILYLIKNPEKAKAMGILGRKRAEELFSIEKNVKATERIYNELLH